MTQHLCAHLVTEILKALAEIPFQLQPERGPEPNWTLYSPNPPKKLRSELSSVAKRWLMPGWSGWSGSSVGIRSGGTGF